jgi:hypothetical protein
MHACFDRAGHLRDEAAEQPDIAMGLYQIVEAYESVAARYQEGAREMEGWALKQLPELER